MTQRGGDAFMSYQLPQAALLLRQGFGRLIRRQSDCGVVAILDTRITRRRYGPLLLRGLPRCRRLRQLQEVVAYFEDTLLRRSTAQAVSEPGTV